jgi:formiminoglutamase
MVDAIRLSVAGKEVLECMSVRDGETKVGQKIQLLSCTNTNNLQSALAQSITDGARYAIIGIAEDIGPRANLGRPGSDKSWDAFLQFFLNMQCNRFLDASRFLLAGQVDLTDIKAKDVQKSADGKTSVSDLRELCAEIDQRVHPVLEQIVLAGLEPIIIGGGNNNSYPTIKGVLNALRKKQQDPGLMLGTANCDPHADFRLIEGRHSGNPFSYADNEGLLRAYCVVGAHENYNSEDMLERLAKRLYPVFYFDQVARKEETWEQQVQHAIDYLSKHSAFTGVELDLDGIKQMPSSAKTPFGITEEQAFYFVYKLASSTDAKYLHLSEASPIHGDDGMRSVGKVLAKTVVEYARGRSHYRNKQPQAVAVSSAAVASLAS